MSDEATLTAAINVRLSADDLADAFCQLDDDAQAQFFVHVARRMSEWEEPIGRAMQLRYIANHLRDCECVTQDARDLVADLADMMREPKTEGVA